MKIVPPNFGYVEENIFRCGAPEPRHFGFLSSLNLRTCVVLTDTADEAFMRWMRESGIHVMCPLLSSSNTGTTAGRGGAVFPNAIGGDMSGSARTGGIDGDSDAFSRVGGGMELATRRDRDGFSREDGPSGPLSAGSRAGDGAGAGALGREDRNNNNNWPGTPLGLSDGSRPHPSNAARFLKENNAYSSPTGRGETPSATYMQSGGALFLSDDVNPDLTNAIGRGLMTLPEPVVVSILQVILDARHYPLLITCSKGRYRSGIVCGCLRKLQGWNLVSILEEYRRYAGNKSRAENEEYIELFDTDLVSVEMDGAHRPSVLYGP